MDISKRILFLGQGEKCFYCSRKLNPWAYEEDNPNGWTIDHFFPKSKFKGMTNNRVMSCRPCNIKKGDRNPTKKEIFKYEKLYNSLRKVEVCN